MAASELSELRAELWRTRDDLERMKSRGTPTSADRSPRRLFDPHHRTSSTTSPAATTAAAFAREGGKTSRSHPRQWHEGVGVTRERESLERKEGGEGGMAVRSGATSPPTSGGSSRGSTGRGLGAKDGDRGDRGGGGTKTGSQFGQDTRHNGRRISVCPDSERAAQGSPEEVAAEETICNLELEGTAFKNWTEEASSIAIRLIEEVKMLRWEKAGWVDRERAAERVAEGAAAELRARADRLEERLRSAEADGRRSQQALARAKQELESEQARVQAEQAKGDALRAALATAQQEKERIQHQQQQRQQEQQQHEMDVAGSRGGRGGLVEMLRREREGADALQRRLDAARAASARHEKERKEWRSSRARLEELRRSWGKGLKKIEKKMRLMARENAALRARVTEAERARDRAHADALHQRDALRLLTEQRDNLLLGATRLGGGRGRDLTPADALAELLAAAAGVVADAAVAGGGGGGSTGGGGIGGGGRPGMATDELEAELEQAKSEAKLAKVEAQQERLEREAAGREKEEAVRQLHRLMGAARRAVGKRDSRLRSSRMETEVVWKALTEAVR